MSATRSRPRPLIQPCVLTTSGTAAPVAANDFAAAAARGPGIRARCRRAAASPSRANHSCKERTAAKYARGSAFGDVSPTKICRAGRT